MVNCNSVRRIWRNVLPGTPFDGLDLLGFIHRDMHTNDRVLLAMILFGVYEFCRFWNHAGHQHNYGPTRTPHAIIHFAITGTASNNGLHTRRALSTLRSILVSPIL